MLGVVLRRVLGLIPTLLLVSLIVFLLVYLVPGDPAITLAGEDATIERVEEIRESLGFNDPIHERYLGWLSDAARGDLGESLFSRQPVTDSIFERLPVTFSLAGGAMAVALLVGVPFGVLAALYRDRWPDRLISLLTSLMIALPGYFVGMLLVLFLAVRSGVFPAARYVPLTEDPVAWFQHLVLPWLALGLTSAAVVTRQLRSSLLSAMSEDYIRTARAKGLRARTVIFKHACKNAAIPTVTVLGSQVAIALGGSVLIERVFGIEGVGSLAISSVLGNDIPMIQGIVVLFTVIVVSCNLVVDLAYGYFNPKVRVS